MKNFIVDGQYQQLLTRNHFDVRKVLRTAQLPENLFTQKHIQLSEPDYYALMRAISIQAPDAQTLVNLATYQGIETFSAPILAAYCSENGLKCIERLGQYKQLIGPIQYHIVPAAERVTITLRSLNGLTIDSDFYVASEFLFLINLLSQATDHPIRPVALVSTYPAFSPAFSERLGCPVTSGETNRITLRTADLQRPFLTDNAALRAYLTPELQRRLANLDVDDSMSAQVRSALVDLLPAGERSIEAVARKLNLSKRSLQRKLKAEQTSFQKQLNSVRAMLAKSYLTNTAMTTDEIAYLLGYLEVNSFLRAFATWTGTSASDYRQQVAKA